MLVDEEAVVGLALRDGTDVVMQADAAHEQDRGELLDWVEERARRTQERKLFVSVADGDDGLGTTLRSRGGAPTERYGYELVYDLEAPPSPSDLPPGFEMISLTPALTDRYIALHRAAWSRPNAPSTYDRRQHDAVIAMPDFRYDLVPIVAAPDGTLAAYCMSWWDPRSRSVEIEPLGTHPDFRRIGLARAIVREVLRRSSALSARYVLVWGTSGNPEAKALYESAGLRPRRTFVDYRLALPSGGEPS